MSIKAPKNIVILGVVIAAVLACTVLLANYSNILPAGADDTAQVKSCQAGAGGPACGMASAQKQALACCAAQSCPSDCDKACCAEGGQAVCPLGVRKPCCPAADAKACPPDCDKPCCAKKGDAADSIEGCCGAAAVCPI